MIVVVFSACFECPNMRHDEHARNKIFEKRAQCGSNWMSGSVTGEWIDKALLWFHQTLKSSSKMCFITWTFYYICIGTHRSSFHAPNVVATFLKKLIFFFNIDIHPWHSRLVNDETMLGSVHASWNVDHCHRHHDHVVHVVFACCCNDMFCVAVF